MIGWPRWGRRARISREANSWAIRMRGPDADDLHDEFEAWRASSPLHAEEYAEAAFLIQASAGAKRTPYSPGTGIRSRRPGAGTWVAIAAAVAAAAGGAVYLEQQAQHPAAAPLVIASASDKHTVRLSDGSTAILDPNSRIDVRFDGHLRAISMLSGKAEFSVAHDAAHPFVVTALNRQVTARGTRFSVSLRDRDISVVMFEGVVDVSHQTDAQDHPSIQLRRGQMLTTAGDEDIVGDALTLARRPSRAMSHGTGASKSLAAAEQVGTSGLMVRTYDATPLATVIADANQGAPKPIRLGDFGLSRIHVEGRFETGDTRALAQVLAAALDLRVEDAGNSWVLTRA